MGRVSTVNDAAIYAAVGRQVSQDGALRLQNVVAETGISIGSLYHRYSSREGLMARAWLDAVRAFQGHFLTAIESGAEDAGERAALATPRFCRAEKARAVILACCRRSEFISDDVPPEFQAEIQRVNEPVIAAVRRYSKRMGVSLRACRLGLVAFPLGAVRMYLPDRPVPRVIDRYVAEAFRTAVRVDGQVQSRR